MEDKLRSINPASGETEFEYAMDDRETAERAVTLADSRFDEWRRTPLQDRSELLEKVARVLEHDRDELALLMAREMGKPVTEGRSEIEKCAWVCRYYAEHGPGFLEPRQVRTERGDCLVCREPLGVILAVMPWNFPFWQVFRFAAPNLLAGNVALLKHASNVPRCAVTIARVFEAAGAPEHLFQSLLIPGRAVGQLIDHPMVRGVTLTGSCEAGRKVAEAAGKAMKKTVFELGGSDPYVVLEDADLEDAATTCAKSRLINGGQSCIAAKRMVVVEAVRERFEHLLVERMAEVVMGDPTGEDTALGPMARFDLRDDLHRQVTGSVERGARLALGGAVPDQAPFDRGAYYPATVLTGVAPGMPAYREELFGPVAAVIPAADRVDAIRIANDSRFGLGAAVFTADAAEGERIAREELDAGTCVVNGLVASDPRLPFGGVKDSGHGRELAVEGIREFLNIKTVVNCRADG